MEPNDSRLSSYYHHHHQSPTTVTTTPTTTVTTTSPTNGLLPNTHPTSEGPPMAYPHSVPSAVSSPLETVRRKRGRPRKYGTPEQALAAKKTTSSSPSSSSVQVSPKKKDPSLGGGGGGGGSSSKKSQLAALGNAGQGFTPHIITVAAGELS
ncbi:hypothetical protein L1049_019553 [Liquidambar formosana]|uniref:AT-hook motif nuclear-localized protein n=1 Tax=Liquidambar formosana TaxID=63359 RepID=A0AAP0SCR8_LIQFO